MVVVVTNPILVKRRRAGWLNAPDEAFFDQHPERVVDRLSRDRTDAGTDVLDNGIHRRVGALRNRPQHRQALGGDWNSILAEKVGGFGHPARLIQFWIESRKFPIQRLSDVGR